MLLVVGLSLIAPYNSSAIGPEPTPTLTPTPGVESLVPWEVDCENESRLDGYQMPSWANDFCVPGEVTWDAWMCGSPGSFTGLMSSYAEGVMERVAERYGVKDGNWRRAGYKGGVALMSCAEVGRKVYLTLPGRGREGPFLVVDCSQRKHMFYHVVHMGLAVEVDYQTAKRWGVYVAPYIEVGKGGVSYRSWWMRHCLEFETEWWLRLLELADKLHLPSRFPPIWWGAFNMR